MNNLVKLRVKRGLSQAQIAKQLGIPLPTYQRYEHGDLPGEKRTIEMAVFFDCSLDYLLGLAEQEKTEMESLAFDEKLVLNSYSQLTDKQKMKVHEYLNELIAEKKEEEKEEEKRPRVRISN